MGEILAPHTTQLKMQHGSKAKGYCFTINNPNGWDDADIETLKGASDYGVVGKEVGECGTPHLQGFVRFTYSVPFKRIKTLLPRAHIEAQRGSVHQASDYCKKDGDFIEWGTLPELKRTGKERWRFIIERAEIGDLGSIRDEYPGEYFRYYDRLKSFRLRDRDILPEITNEWWYGPTGTGKSRLVWEQFPDHYGKQLNKWWDGYEDEEVVVIEEWCPKNEMTASNLKIWADRYPFNAEIKGGQLKRIRPKKVIVTSNYTMEQCFEKIEDLEPIKRRFKAVYFPPTIFSVDSLFEC